jgi:hypothetical protein
LYSLFGYNSDLSDLMSRYLVYSTPAVVMYMVFSNINFYLIAC